MPFQLELEYIYIEQKLITKIKAHLIKKVTKKMRDLDT